MTNGTVHIPDSELHLVGLGIRSHLAAYSLVCIRHKDV